MPSVQPATHQQVQVRQRRRVHLLDVVVHRDEAVQVVDVPVVVGAVVEHHGLHAYEQTRTQNKGAK